MRLRGGGDDETAHIWAIWGYEGVKELGLMPGSPFSAIFAQHYTLIEIFAQHYTLIEIFAQHYTFDRNISTAQATQPESVLGQRPKNLGSRVALLPGKFLRV